MLNRLTIISFLAFLLWPWTVRAQLDSTTDTIVIVPSDTFIFIRGDSLRSTDSVLALCKERGHVKVGDGWSTTMCCPTTTLVDLHDRSLVIYTDPNVQRWNCKRCGASGIYGPDTTVIWQKPDSSLHFYNNVIINGGAPSSPFFKVRK